MRCILLFFIAAFWCCSPAGHAQTVDRDAFHATDSLVDALGPMRDSSLASIVKALTKNATSELNKLRAIYKWVAKNVAYDCAHRRNTGRVNNTTSYVLRSREATSEGFAGMIGEMCRMCYLHCEIVHGLVKWDPEEIGNVDPETAIAAWNVVQIGIRKYVLDAGAGAGTCSGKTFSKAYTDAWFLTQRKLFVLCHYPQDKRQQLLDTPVEKSVFMNAPTIHPDASVIGVFPAAGQRGRLKGREGDSVRISVSLSAGQTVTGARIVADGERRDVSFIQDGDMLQVNIPFKKSGTYPVYLVLDTKTATKIAINAGPLLGFMAEVAKRRQ